MEPCGEQDEQVRELDTVGGMGHDHLAIGHVKLIAFTISPLDNYCNDSTLQKFGQFCWSDEPQFHFGHLQLFALWIYTIIANFTSASHW